MPRVAPFRWLIAATLASVTPSVLLAATGEPDAAAAPARSAKNIALDAARKPDQTLDFAGIGPGSRVLDLFGGNLYWAELMVPRVGPTGLVVGWQPTQFLNPDRRASLAAFAASNPRYAWLASRFETPRLGTALYDAALVNLDYHDVYWSSAKNDIPVMDPDAWLAQLRAAIRPGGSVTVIDHRAAPGGDPRQVADALHRIDPAVVKADFARAGFVLEAEDSYLANPQDALTVNVFDPAIRGKTDRFALRFRKPAA